MKRSISLIGLLGALVMSMSFVLPNKQGQQVTPPQYFPETNHSVRAPFVDFFMRTGGVSQYGYPITDDYVDQTTGLLIQYFEKARLEWHPGNPDPYKVQLGLLGDEMGKRAAPIPITKMPAANDPSCLNFMETGHTVCLDFRKYWLENGGLDRFGYPITEFTAENGYVVQYFQRAMFVWRPEKPEGRRVQVEALGLIYYDWARLDESRMTRGRDNAGVDSDVPPTEIRAHASAFIASPKVGDTQVVFVNVTNQLNAPLGSAAVTLVVHFPTGDVSYQLPPTSASGTTFQTFVVPETAAGTIVTMEFIITHSGLFGDTRTSYMLWY